MCVRVHQCCQVSVFYRNFTDLSSRLSRTTPLGYKCTGERHIASSSKGCRFAYCRLYDKHFTVSHGGFLLKYDQ